MKFTQEVFIHLLVSVALASCCVNGLQPRIDASSKDKSDISNRIKHNDFLKAHENEIDDRIQVVEPYKSLIQTTARIGIAQTRISNIIDIDTAMKLLNKAGYMLSKPAILFKAIKATLVAIATLLATTFFFPGAFAYLEAVWRNPVEALNLDGYISNGLSARSVLNIIGSTTDEALSKVGLYESSCRKKSICYLGEMLKCTFPETSESLVRFANENFPDLSDYRENKYTRAFSAGFVDRNCTRLPDDGNSQDCFSKFISSVLISRWGGKDSSQTKNKYQTIQVGRTS